MWKTKKGLSITAGKLRAQMSRRGAIPVVPWKRPTQDLPPGLQFSFLMYATWNQSDPASYALTDLIGSPMRLGYNWQAWKTAAERDGLTWSASSPSAGPPAGRTHHFMQYTDTSDGNASKVLPLGDGVLWLASKCVNAFFGHHLPSPLIRRVKDLSDNRTRVGHGFLNYESINQKQAWYPGEAAMQAVSLGTNGARLVVPKPLTGCNGGTAPTPLTHGTPYNCPVIDKYESTNTQQFDQEEPPNSLGRSPLDPAPWNSVYCAHAYNANADEHSYIAQEYLGCPHSPKHATPLTEIAEGYTHNAWATSQTSHTWDVDITSSGYKEAFIAAVATDLYGDTDHFVSLGNYGAPECFMFDNTLDRPYKGTASPDYPVGYTDVAYLAAWKSFLTSFNNTYSGIGLTWGNHLEDCTYYSCDELRNRFCEYFFSNPGGSIQVIDTLADLKTRISGAVQNGLQIIMNTESGGTPAIFTDAPHTYWTGLVEHIASLGAERLVTSSIRNYLYYPAGFRAL